VTCRIGEIVIEAEDLERTAAFWCSALGYRVTARDVTGVALAGHSSAPTILIVRSGEPKRAKNRIHFDLCPTDGDQQAEVDRLLSLGATRVDIGQGDVSWVVLADPAGNELCVMRTSIPPEPAPFHDLEGSSPD